MPIDTDTMVVTAPPRTSAGRAPKTRTTAKGNERREALDGFAQIIGFGCIVTRQYADAGAIGLHKDPIISELVDLADKNEKIARAIDYLTEAGPYAGLIVAVMPLAIQIAANHGLVKAELVSGAGVLPPAALEAGVKADMARQAAAAIQQQREAEAELARIAADLRPEDGSQGVPEANGAGQSRGRKAGTPA